MNFLDDFVGKINDFDLLFERKTLESVLKGEFLELAETTVKRCSHVWSADFCFISWEFHF
jgi:hypothetical protein